MSIFSLLKLHEMIKHETKCMAWLITQGSTLINARALSLLVSSPLFIILLSQHFEKKKEKRNYTCTRKRAGLLVGHICLVHNDGSIIYSET